MRGCLLSRECPWERDGGRFASSKRRRPHEAHVARPTVSWPRGGLEAPRYAVVAQLVGLLLPKQVVAGSSPVYRSRIVAAACWLAGRMQSVEEATATRS